MSIALKWVGPPDRPIYRIARTPFLPVDWHWTQNHLERGTFDNRFDDPRGRVGLSEANRFRMFYCATERVAAFAETLADFQMGLQDLGVLINTKVSNPSPVLQGTIRPGLFSAKRIADTELNPNLRFVDLDSVQTLQTLRCVPRLARTAKRLGLDDIDRSTIALADRYRRLTQEIACFLYGVGDENGNSFDGLRYVSRLGGEWECWALFDKRVHGKMEPSTPREISLNDTDLVKALDLLNIRLG